MLGLFINPDLWMYLGLEEKSLGSGIWWDPRRVIDVMVRRTIDGKLQAIDIRSDYLLKYLQARQMCLVVGHYRQLLLFKPTQSQIDAFQTGDITIGSAIQGAKALLQNWGLQQRGGSEGINISKGGCISGSRCHHLRSISKIPGQWSRLSIPAPSPCQQRSGRSRRLAGGIRGAQREEHMMA